jgi:hypothetical protein
MLLLMPSADRDAAVGRAISQQAPGGSRLFNTNEQTGYPPAIVRSKAEEVLKENFRWGVRRTIAGYEPTHMIPKARRPEACWVQKVGLLHRFILGLFAAT